MNSIDNIPEIDHSIIHIIPSFACNLNCPHCDEKHKVADYKFDRDKFFNVFNQIQRKDNSIALFGGEALMNDYDLLNDIIKTKKITTITTNLIGASLEKIKLLVDNDIIIGTSWNPKRFTDEQYKEWLAKLCILKKLNVHPAIFITLTDDLIDSNILEVLDTLDKLEVASVTFALVVPCTPELVEKIDNWLCWLEEHWRWRFRHMLREKYLKLDATHRNGCLNTSFVLYPNGDFKQECVHTDTAYHLDRFDFCNKCPFITVCNPCPKHDCCTFFKNYWTYLTKTTMHAVYDENFYELKRTEFDKKQYFTTIFCDKLLQ